MKKFIVALMSLISIDVYANDSAVKISGGSASIIGNVEAKIQMLSEKIILKLDKSTIHTDASFIFFNNENKSIKLKVGFPEYRYGTSEETSLYDFNTWVNDKSTKFQIVKDIEDTRPDILRWYIKEVTFHSQNKTTSRVTYSAPFALYGFYSGAEYLYGTGKSWNDVIHEIEIIIENKQNFWINELGFTNKNVKFDVINTLETIKVLARDIKPNVLDIFYVHFGTKPVWVMETIFTPFEELWIKELQKIDDKYLAMLTNQQLRILRNTFYATYGYVFKTEDLQLYFKEMKWYKPNSNFSESQISNADKKVIDMVYNEENKRNSNK